MMARSVPYITLSTVGEMPIVGYGTAEDDPNEADQTQTASSVLKAIDVGYRLFDTAQFYNTEIGVGQGINSAINSGKVSRDEIFVSTKLWATHHLREDVVPNLRKSLDRLGLDYVDLFLIHGPTALKPGNSDEFPIDENGEIIFADIDFLETWKGMEECVDLGLAKSAGVSNFNKRQIQLVIDNCRIKPGVNQIEANLFFQNSRLIEFCQTRGVAVTGFMPLQFLNAATASNKQATELVEVIARQHNKTTQQIALKFQVQQNIAVIPQSHNAEHMRQNIQLFDFELTKEDMERLRGLDTNIRAFDFESDKSQEYPFRDPY